MTIRKNNTDKCPFGLKIPFACENAGKIIKNMAPIEILGPKANIDEKKQLALTNARILVWQNTCERCFFAGKIFDDKSAVECNFGTNTAGEGSEKALLGTPYYSRLYDNIAYDGLYSYPIGYDFDSNISQNSYYGVYSLCRDETEFEEVIKIAGDIVRLDILIKKRDKEG